MINTWNFPTTLITLDEHSFAHVVDSVTPFRSMILSCQRSSHFSNNKRESACSQPAVSQLITTLISLDPELKPCRILLEFTLRKGELNGRLKEEVSTWVKRNALLDNCRTFPCIIFNTVKKLSFQAGHIHFTVKIWDRFVCTTVYWPIKKLVVDIS